MTKKKRSWTGWAITSDDNLFSVHEFRKDAERRARDYYVKKIIRKVRITEV